VTADSADGTRRQRWGTATALSDDDEARRRIIAAATRCIARHGTAKVPIEQIAAEAGVSRMTVYRYFGNRDDVVLAVIVGRIDARLSELVHSLRSRRQAAQALPELILKSVGLVAGDRVNEGLLSADSRSLIAELEFSSEPVIDALHRHLAPLLRQWQVDGQLYADLDLRETTRWINAVAILLITPPWRDLSPRAQRTFLNQYLIRALVVPAGGTEAGQS
jgi:TetR/AcrR family transcriptional regulator